MEQSKIIDTLETYHRVVIVALEQGLDGASRTSRREIHRARLPQLEGWPTGEPPHASPTVESSTGRCASSGGSQGGGKPLESTGTESTIAARGRRGRMHESALLHVRGVCRRRVEPLKAKQSRR